MSKYTEGATHQFANQLERAGFTDHELRRAGEAKHLESFLGTFRGTHRIVPIENVFDASLPCQFPFYGAMRKVQYFFDGDNTIWKLEKHGGDLYANDKKIGVYRSEYQLGGQSIEGYKLRAEIDGKPEAKLPAALLDYLVEHPMLWPECWKKDENGDSIYIYIYFWGDIFNDPGGALYVRYGCWRDGQVISEYSHLYKHWSGNNPAGSLAS